MSTDIQISDAMPSGGWKVTNMNLLALVERVQQLIPVVYVRSRHDRVTVGHSPLKSRFVRDGRLEPAAMHVVNSVRSLDRDGAAHVDGLRSLVDGP